MTNTNKPFTIYAYYLSEHTYNVNIWNKNTYAEKLSYRLDILSEKCV